MKRVEEKSNNRKYFIVSIDQSINSKNNVMTFTIKVADLDSGKSYLKSSIAQLPTYSSIFEVSIYEKSVDYLCSEYCKN